MRKTSLDAYNKIKSEGLLSKLRFDVYETLFKYGPMTQGECWKVYFNHRQRHDICPRFAELSKHGVIDCVGERPCKVTGINSMIWDVNDRVPEKLPKQKPRILYLELGLFGSVLKYSDSPFEGAFKFKECK